MDHRDTVTFARQLRAAELTPVWVSDQARGFLLDGNVSDHSNWR